MSEMITKKHSYFRGNKIDSDDGCIKSVNILKIIKLSDLNWWAVLSHKKEPIWLSSNEVDEPRAYYTVRSKSEREKQTSYINAYIWNLEGWYWSTYFLGSNGDMNMVNVWFYWVFFFKEFSPFILSCLWQPWSHFSPTSLSCQLFPKPRKGKESLYCPYPSKFPGLWEIVTTVVAAKVDFPGQGQWSGSWRACQFLWHEYSHSIWFYAPHVQN